PLFPYTTLFRSTRLSQHSAPLGHLNYRYRRGTRLEIAQSTSYEIVPDASARSCALSDVPPSSPINVTTSPTVTPGTVLTSRAAWSMLMVPAIGTATPRTIARPLPDARRCRPSA